MAHKAAEHPHEQKTGGLPVLVISPTDLGRLIRELGSSERRNITDDSSK